MATPVANTYNTGDSTLYGGRFSGPNFDKVKIRLESSDGLPGSTASKIAVFTLHGSGGQNLTNGRQYTANCSGEMCYEGYSEFFFSTVLSSNPAIFLLRPVDQYGLYPGNGAKRESMWLGFTNMPTPDVALITQRRLEALATWSKANIPSVTNKMCLNGGSMGAWGTLTFGVRRKHLFAAIYPDRPRWRYNYTVGKIAVANWNGIIESVFVEDAPNLTPADGGGSVADLQNIISYVSDTNNPVPFIGWVIGRADGFMPFSEHIDAVAAMRTAKRGFAFYWDEGNHDAGSRMSQILQSYPYGTFTIGQGYPLFTNHSGDQDPSVDLVGGINIGLSFRNVVETSSGWSCEVTSVLGSRTVEVEPISDIFVTPVAKQLVTIPSANSWVPVSF